MWGLNRLLTKLRHPPIFHGATLFYTIQKRPLKGTFYASVPYVLALTLVFHWFATPNQQYPRSEVTPPQLNSMEQTTTYQFRNGLDAEPGQPGAYRGVLTCRGAFTSLDGLVAIARSMGGFFFEFELFRKASGPSRRFHASMASPPRRHRRDPTRVYVVIRTPSTRCHIGPLPVNTMLRAGHGVARLRALRGDVEGLRGGLRLPGDVLLEDGARRFMFCRDGHVPVSNFKLCFNLRCLGVWVRCCSLNTVSTISRRSCPSLGLSEGRGAEIARRIT